MVFAKHVALRLAFGIVTFAALFVSMPNSSRANVPPDDADRVVARVGKAVITVAELEQRLSLVSSFQRQTYGSTPEQIKRGFLEQVLIPETMMVQAAIDRGMVNDREVIAKRREVLRQALMAKLRVQAKDEATITDNDVQAYYQAHIGRYRTPPLVSVWRLLVADERIARQVIAQVANELTPSKWAGLVSAYSIDKSSQMSGGNLGFVTQQGVSADGKTRISEAVAQAAFGVRDGELVPEPVKEGSAFAVVWRRGSMPAINRSLEEERASIRETLLQAHTTRAILKLTEDLTAKHVQVLVRDAALLVDVQAGGTVSLETKPGRITPGAGRTEPTRSPRGLR